MEKKRLMFVIPTIRYGGTELFLFRLCKLVCSKYEVILIVIGNRDGLFKEFEALHIRMHYLGFEKVAYFPMACLKLRRIIKSEAPDVIQSWLYQADILSGIASIGLKVKLIIWSLRGTSLAPGTSNFKLLIQKSAAILSTKIPHSVIACSKEARDFHIDMGYPANRMLVVGNFLASWAREVESKSIFLSESRPTHFKIGLAARYELGKGHEALLMAVLEFLKKNPTITITLCFAGKGCDNGGRLSDAIHPILIRPSNVECNKLTIITSGLLSGPSLVNWFQGLDLYFMASDSEGFPNSLAEAIAIGLPSLATPIGAVMEFLSSERLSESATSKSMSELLERFYEEEIHSKQKVTKELREKMLNTYREEKILAAYNNAWKIQD